MIDEADRDGDGEVNEAPNETKRINRHRNRNVDPRCVCFSIAYTPENSHRCFQK